MQKLNEENRVEVLYEDRAKYTDLKAPLCPAPALRQREKGGGPRRRVESEYIVLTLGLGLVV